ncbi:MAG: TrmB family transcriptional regulator [Thaumarchaeota archaeon]|nr:TrmB family transcriptional regulator [Nitrososphaerota archaeon]
MVLSSNVLEQVSPSQKSLDLGQVSPNQRIAVLEQEISKILELEELDSHIYLSLLRMGPVTASALAKELHIDRTKVYRTVDKLLTLKIVSTTFSKPKLCVANKPEEVIKNVLQLKQTQVNKIRNTKDYLIKRIQETIPINYSSNIPTFHVVQGTANIYSDIEKLIENANGTVYILTTLKDLSKMYHTDIPEKIKICEKNGGQVRLLTEITKVEFLPFMKRFGATETRIGKLSSRGRMIVEEGKQMLMSDAVWGDSDQSNIDSDYAINTNSGEMVNNIFILCDLLWANSKPLKI